MNKSTTAITDNTIPPEGTHWPIPAPLALNATRDVLGVVGHITCMNVAPQGQPEKIRYVGMGKGCSGQAHETEAQAEQDVLAWHQGKDVKYPHHATVPTGQSFIIGAGNTWAQAWDALQAGHQVRMASWLPEYSWILENNARELYLVAGTDPQAWAKTIPQQAFLNAQRLLYNNWTVLPKISVEPPTV